MRRDSAERSQDMQLLEQLSMSDLSLDAIADYRAAMRALRPGHVLERCSNNELLIQLNGAGTGQDGVLHPSIAGLLMFGKHEAILSALPAYEVAFLTEEGAVSAAQLPYNLYHFSRHVMEELALRFPRSVTAQDAVREALTNCLVNADYRVRGGVLVESFREMLRFSNPGGFRIDPRKARTGGVSDARNKALSRMFLLIGMGAGVGGGIPRMFANWRKGARPTPFFCENFDPERTTLTLPLRRTPGCIQDAAGQRRAISPPAAKQLLAEYLTGVISARAGEISSAVGMPLSRVRYYLGAMRREGIVISEGQGRNTVWRLRERAGL